MSLVQKFIKDKSGNFALLFGLTLLPVSLIIGAAVDYTRLSSDESISQDRLDAAILSGAVALSSKSEAEVKQLIIDEFKAYLPENIANNITSIDVIVNKKSGQITANASAYTKTTVMGVAGYDKLDFDVNASVKMKVKKLEVALVLDNTGSMEVDEKLTSLKKSASDFVTKLFDDGSDGNVHVGLVPFAKYVNVGKSKRNKSWINVPDDYTESGTYTHKPVLSSKNCVTKTYYSDGVPKEYESCDRTYGPPVEKPYTNKYTWHGCVGSRPAPFNLKDNDYVGKNRVPGLLMRWRDCPNPVQALISNKSKLLKKINKMQAKGDTYIPAGVVWGTRVLSNHAPFTRNASSTGSAKSKKVMILMTDGDNSVSADLPANPTHTKKDLAQANQWTSQACDNAKSAGINVFTITFGKDIKNDTKALMVGCASKPDNYFDATNADKLNDAFDDILKKLGKLHLSS